jgi:Peptidase family M50
VSTTPAPAQTSSTPILDRLVPPPASAQLSDKSRRLRAVIAFLAVLIPSLWIGLMMNSMATVQWSEKVTVPASRFLDRTVGNIPNDHYWPWLVWFLLSPMLAVFLVIVVHEFGHAVIGVLTGFRVLSIHFGRLQISWPFHVKWYRSTPLPGASGFVQLTPVYSQKLRARAVAMVFGGPAANLLPATLLLIFDSQMGFFSACFVLMSILIGVINLLPFQRKALTSDGMKILTLLRNGPEGERWLALLGLVADIRNGVETEKLDPDFVAIATAVIDDSPQTVLAHSIAHAMAYYRHDDAEASRLLEICLEHLGRAAPLMREAVFADAAGFQAKRRKRLDLARQWLADLPEQTIMPEIRLKTESSILAAEGDIQAAMKKLDEAELLVRKSAEPMRLKLSLRLLEREQAEIMQDHPAATTTVN